MDMVSIVIPTLNESENINPLLERVFKNCSLGKTEVIFVDDDSSDGTDSFYPTLAKDLSGKSYQKKR